jgi:glyoxylate utilization-related uncharacterized protein
MKKVELKDVPEYSAAGHFGCIALRLQHKDLTGAQAFWVGLSHFLPKGGAEMGGGDFERVYLVLSGEITVTGADGKEFTLGPMDSLYMAPGEKRSILNKTNMPASMLVVAEYPKPK